MSEAEVTTKISKPPMRRLLYNQIKRNLFGAGISVVIAGLCMQFFYTANFRNDYANFYKSYDIDKEFERMRKKEYLTPVMQKIKIKRNSIY